MIIYKLKDSNKYMYHILITVLSLKNLKCGMEEIA